MMKYLYILLVAAIVSLPINAHALNATPSDTASSSEPAADKNPASPNFGKADEIISFVIGPNMGSICGYLKLPPKLDAICSKILECLVDIALDKVNAGRRTETPGASSGCGFEQCYAAVVGAKKVQSAGLSADQKKTAQSKLSSTISSCSALCNNLPANSKAQKICGLTDCYDDAVKLVADPNYEFPEYCCSIVSGKWGGNIGKAIDTFCKGTSGVNDVLCAVQWSSNQTLSGECCAGIDDLKSSLSDPDLAATYCKAASALEDCKIHWEDQVANCNAARARGYACTEKPNDACCVLINQKESDTNIAKLMDKIGITGTKDSYKDTCGDVPDSKSTIDSLKITPVQ